MIHCNTHLPLSDCVHLIASSDPMLAVSAAVLGQGMGGLLMVLSLLIVLGVAGALSSVFHLFTIAAPNSQPKSLVSINLVVSMLLILILGAAAVYFNQENRYRPLQACIASAGVLAVLSLLTCIRTYLARRAFKTAMAAQAPRPEGMEPGIKQ